MATARARIGTSGWHYAHWVGPFYREGTPERDFLRRYADVFDTVEINNTFYQLPRPATVAAWRAAVPRGFVFACKASRFITHMKKLREPRRSTRRFFTTVRALGPSLGPILFQLPPRWHRDAGRLSAFLDALPSGHRYAFEFRDASWFGDEVDEVLARHNAALCLYELGGRRAPMTLTADFVYVRLHGPRGPYQGSYDGRTLRAWARRIERWLGEARDVWCYFDNDQCGFAALDALRLRAMVPAAG